MIRKTILAIAATAALGATALAPTSASAWGFKGGFHHHFFFPHVRYYNYVDTGCYYKYRWVYNDDGYRVRIREQICY
jgi:hypothetical protein